MSGTKIFARDSGAGRQFLVYEMSFKADDELAMILPLPVPAGTAEAEVRFIDLSKYVDIFADMRRAFPESRSVAAAVDTMGAEPDLELLDVVQVGRFEASFVPKLSDFSRLDRRFRLDDAVWRRLPHYARYGFAVFKLKPGAHDAHPMAFEFPRADPTLLFFPTVHVHDGEVHGLARFDHALYCQLPNWGRPAAGPWTESQVSANRFVQIERTQGIVDGQLRLHRRLIHGETRNADQFV